MADLDRRLHECVEPRLVERIALRIPEAAAMVGISENSFRDHLLADCPKVYIGKSVRIPRELFVRWIEDRTRDEDPNATARELLSRALERGSE